MRNIKFSKIFIENIKQIVSLLVLVSSLIIIDQVTKSLAQKYLENSTSIVIIPNFISLHFVRNEITYIHQYILYFILSVIVVPVIIFYSIEKSFSRGIIIGLALLWSAVISNNLLDAFLLGYIRDFIKLHGVATGNIADQYRTIGLLIIIVALIIKDEKNLIQRLL
ncbi:MAG: signal peptidase II [Melioribacteraceae bacterium]